MDASACSLLHCDTDRRLRDIFSKKECRVMEDMQRDRSLVLKTRGQVVTSD